MDERQTRVVVTIKAPVYAWQEFLEIAKAETILPSDWVKECLFLDVYNNVEVEITEEQPVLGFDVAPDPAPKNFGHGKE